MAKSKLKISDRALGRARARHDAMLRATHIKVFPSGAYLEFRPSQLGSGWASRAVNSAGRPDSWIYFGPELPDDAKKL